MHDLLWRIARTDDNQLHALQLPDETVEELAGGDLWLFPVTFTSKQDAQAVVTFIERMIEKAIVGRTITVMLDGKELVVS